MKHAAQQLHCVKKGNDEIVSRHFPLVKRIAYQVLSNMPNTVNRDDLMQAGTMGLLEAMRAYDSSQGASFETYARIRIHGAMIDEIRRNDWTPRSVYRKARVLSEAAREIECRTGCRARSRDMARELGLSMGEYNSLVCEADKYRMVSYEEMTSLATDEAGYTGGDGSTASLLIERDEFMNELSLSISRLPEKHQQVMALYYDEELNMREIGEVLGVSEGRVSQIRSEAIRIVRESMKDWATND